MNPVAVLPSKETSGLSSRNAWCLSAGPSAGLAYDVSASSTGPIVGMSAALVLAGFGVSVAVLLVHRSRRVTPRKALDPLVEPVQTGTLSTTERRRPAADADEGAAGTHQGGGISVLVAVLGEPTAVADANPVLRSVGRHLGEVTLARPVGVDEASRGWDEARQAAIRTLSQAALFVVGSPPRLVPIPGRGEAAVACYAATQAVGVVVLVGDPDVDPDLCRRPELWGCTIVVVA